MIFKIFTIFSYAAVFSCLSVNGLDNRSPTERSSIFHCITLTGVSGRENEKRFFNFSLDNAAPMVHNNNCEEVVSVVTRAADLTVRLGKRLLIPVRQPPLVKLRAVFYFNFLLTFLLACVIIFRPTAPDFSIKKVWPVRATRKKTDIP